MEFTAFSFSLSGWPAMHTDRLTLRSIRAFGTGNQARVGEHVLVFMYVLSFMRDEIEIAT